MLVGLLTFPRWACLPLFPSFLPSLRPYLLRQVGLRGGALSITGLADAVHLLVHLRSVMVPVLAATGHGTRNTGRVPSADTGDLQVDGWEGGRVRMGMQDTSWTSTTTKGGRHKPCTHKQKREGGREGGKEGLPCGAHGGSCAGGGRHPNGSPHPHVHGPWMHRWYRCSRPWKRRSPRSRPEGEGGREGGREGGVRGFLAFSLAGM